MSVPDRLDTLQRVSLKQKRLVHFDGIDPRSFSEGERLLREGIHAPMKYLKRKMANALEYLHPSYLKAVVRGDAPERRKLIRQQLRPQPAARKTKEEAVRSYAARHNCRVLIETGTFKGDMIFAMLRHFDRLYSIEMGRDLFLAAKKRFENEGHVKILEGDSGKRLPEILKELAEPAAFWLDAHASGGETARGRIDTPIEKELKEVLNHPIKKHVILIDDAREFGMGKHYPTLKKVEKIVFPTYKHYEVRDDIIRITS